MNRFAYYEEMKELARKVRTTYRLDSPRVLKSDLRKIYRAEQIRIDLWPQKLRNLRGAYLNDEFGATVLIAAQLPDEPKIFTMAHELKHHLVDQNLPFCYCDPSNQLEKIEIGAEIFAAELIFPEQDFSAHLCKMGIGKGECIPEGLVQLKHRSRTTLSYAGLAKRAEFMEFASPGALEGIKWKKLEEKLLGEADYKRILRYRSNSVKLNSDKR